MFETEKKLSSVNVKDEVDIGCIELMHLFPFYGHILVQLPKFYLEKKDNQYAIPTLGVGKDGKEEMLVKMYIVEEYVKEVYGEYKHTVAFTHLMEVIKHEIIHIVFNHLSIDMPDKARAAAAADLSVNSYCEKDNFVFKIDPKSGQKISQGLFPEDYSLPPKKSFIFYYNQLLNNKKFKKQCQEGAFGVGGLFSDVVSSHEMWKKALEDPMLKEMVKDLVRKSAKLCRETKNWGNTPAEMIEQIDELVKLDHAILPWQSILRLFCASAMESNLDYTMKRRSKRFGTRPGTKKEDVLNLAIGIDTSGSISNEQLKMFFNELYWMSKNGAIITVFEADTEITREYPYAQFDGKVRGRGGTDLEPILREVADRKFDALIYFTDFYAPKISKNYGVPVLWVLSECDLNREDYPYDWGQYIHIDRDTIAA